VEWMNEPATWSLEGTDLHVTTEPSTDFWRVTGEGVDAVRDNGHIFGETLSGDFDLTVDVIGVFSEQYDQAGVMIRVNDRQWFKTGVEFLDGRPRFSTVVTFDYSNWTFTDLPDSFDRLSIRIAYRGDAVEVHRSVDGGPEEFSAHLYLPPGEEKFVGVMSAAPKGRGFNVIFRNLVITPVESAS
jgi:regulation of enolase protein 1 (concanavalin A-like superfamily)